MCGPLRSVQHVNDISVGSFELLSMIYSEWNRLVILFSFIRLFLALLLDRLFNMQQWWMAFELLIATMWNCCVLLCNWIFALHFDVPLGWLQAQFGHYQLNQLPFRQYKQQRVRQCDILYCWLDQDCIVCAIKKDK